MKILLVKLSSLGDVVHTLPVVDDILAAVPGAQIDWVVEKGFAPLLARCPGVHRIVPCEIRRWRKSFWAVDTRAQWAAFRTQLHTEAYDAVIDLQGLTKSALVARLARLAPGGRRFALANQTDGSGYEAPTRWVADAAIAIAPHTAAVQRSRELCARALGYAVANAPDFGLVPHHIDIAPAADAPCVAFVHGTSRADKGWPLDHWLAIGHRLLAAGVRIGLPHGNADELSASEAMAEALNESALPGRPRAAVWPRLALDAVTDAIAACHGVIGVDSGISHIAVALDVPHVQIYNFDTAWRTGPMPWPGDARPARQRSVFAEPAPTVDAVWQAWIECEAAALPAPAGIAA